MRQTLPSSAQLLTAANNVECAQEIEKLQEWIEVLEDTEDMKKAAEECRAREARAPALAREAKAASKRILNERQTELARCVLRLLSPG